MTRLILAVIPVVLAVCAVGLVVVALDSLQALDEGDDQ